MKKLTDQEKIDVVSTYIAGGHTCKDLSLQYGVSSDSIRGILSRRGVKLNRSQFSRKYALNEFYFDEIDTQDKAYLLGLLYADGYNHVSLGVLNLNLQEVDVDILKKFSECIGTNKPLQFINVKKQYPTRSNIYRLSLTSRHISNTLNKLGCGQRKTFTVVWPEFLEKALWPHFIRGLWDGDGYIGDKQTTLTGTEELCNSLKSILKEELDVNCWMHTRHPERENNIRSIVISGRNKMKKFLHWIYQDSNLFLERKYKKYLDLLNWKPKPYSKRVASTQGLSTEEIQKQIEALGE